MTSTDEVRDELMQELQLKENMGKRALLLKEYIERSVIPVAISFRQGKDYKDAGYPICTQHYYLTGIKKIEQQYPNCSFFVFADDFSIAKNILRDRKNVIFVDHTNAVEQFMLMRLCQLFVLSNSSFAWWGAYMAKKAYKIYFPEHWYPHTATANTNLLFINSEILVDN